MNSLWIDSVKGTSKFESLDKNSEADICIIGAGILGMTCGYYLSHLGFKVILIDKNNLAGTTSFTTGKITSQHDLFYSYLNTSYDMHFAKDYLEVNEKAIKNIKDIINKEQIDCDFEIQNSYVYTTKKEEVNLLEKEQKVLESLDYHAELTKNVSLPFEVESALCFKNQAKFNPLKYILGLSKSIIEKNGQIYTNTTAVDIEKDKKNYVVYTDNGKMIKAKHVIMATRYPFMNVPGFYFSKLYQSTSYIIALDTKNDPLNDMYINISSPIYSFRTTKFNGKDILLLASGNSKTGHNYSQENPYDVLKNFAKQYYPNCDVLYEWSSEDCISLDKLPYIGKYSSLLPNVYVGTGFKKWGMTLSNVAANLIVDEICERKNPYAYLFDSTRFGLFKNFDEVKNMLVDSTNSLLLNKLKASDTSLENIKPHSGDIIELDGKKVGVYRDKENKIHAINPICTHLGCLLTWNDIDKTWDCPCHGSRYDAMGKNLYGPAFKDLEIYQ